MGLMRENQTEGGKEERSPIIDLMKRVDLPVKTTGLPFDLGISFGGQGIEFNKVRPEESSQVSCWLMWPHDELPGAKIEIMEVKLDQVQKLVLPPIDYCLMFKEVGWGYQPDRFRLLVAPKAAEARILITDRVIERRQDTKLKGNGVRLGPLLEDTRCLELRPRGETSQAEAGVNVLELHEFLPVRKTVNGMRFNMPYGDIGRIRLFKAEGEIRLAVKPKGLKVAIINNGQITTDLTKSVRLKLPIINYFPESVQDIDPKILAQASVELQLNPGRFNAQTLGVFLLLQIGREPMLYYIERTDSGEWLGDHFVYAGGTATMWKKKLESLDRAAVEPYMALKELARIYNVSPIVPSKPTMARGRNNFTDIDPV